MCYSAEASFTAGAVLLPSSIYCVHQGLQGNRRSLLLALVPAFFGIQQLCEGMVWIALDREDTALIRTASLWFLFFALAFWPFWIPLGVSVLEPKRAPWRGAVLFTILGLAWSGVLFLPLLIGPPAWLTTHVVAHSIRYDYTDLPVFQILSPEHLRLLYLSLVVIPLLLCSLPAVRGFGLLLFLSAAISHLAFAYAFTSVWCFMAALLSIYLCLVFRRIARGPQVLGRA